MARRKLTIQEAQERFDAIPEGQVLRIQGTDKMNVFSRIGEEWRMAFSHETKAHEELPIHWFVSTKDFRIISVSSEIPCFLHVKPKKPGSPYYNVNRPTKGVFKYHNLKGLVWNSYMDSESKDLFNQYGLNAFQHGVNGHHKDSAWNNDPQTIQFIVKHQNIHHALDSDPITKLARTIDTPSIIITGERYHMNGAGLPSDKHMEKVELSSGDIKQLLSHVNITLITQSDTEKQL